MTTEINTSNFNSDFNSKQYANGLLLGGCIGIILTLFFLHFSRDLATDYTTGPWWEENYAFELFIYYLINSLLVVGAGIFLKRRKKIGLHLLFLVTLSVLVSFFVADDGTNIFLWTVGSSVFVFFTGAPLGVLIFLGSIVANIVKVKKWLLVCKSKSA